jgi:hypothetical protein
MVAYLHDGLHFHSLLCVQPDCAYNWRISLGVNTVIPSIVTNWLITWAYAFLGRLWRLVPYHTPLKSSRHPFELT